MEEHHSDRLKLEEDRLLKLHSSLCKVMSNPRRTRMIHLLEEGEKNVGELVEATGLLKARKVLTACNAMEELFLELLEEENAGA